MLGPAHILERHRRVTKSPYLASSKFYFVIFGHSGNPLVIFNETPLIPIDSSFWTRMGRETVSKAFLVVIYIILAPTLTIGVNKEFLRSAGKILFRKYRLAVTY